jgi:hypothetical protein
VPSLDIFPPSNPFVDSSSLLPWTSAGSYEASSDDFHVANTHLSQSSYMFEDLGLPTPAHQDLSSLRNAYPSLVCNGSIQSEHFPFSYQCSSIDYSDIAIPNPLESALTLRAPRAFVPKTMRHRQLSLNRKFVVVTLSAYPQMMLPGKRMPPFIHSRCSVEESSHHGLVAQVSLPTPLATCSGIIAMWSVKNKDNSGLIWRAIRTEQERISDEVDSSCSISYEKS